MTGNLATDEWLYQWSRLRDRDTTMLWEWIAPFRAEDFAGREVLECGCGGGHHTAIVARYAKSVTAIDRSTAEVARERCAGLDNVRFLAADLMTLDLGRQFDVVMCIGVIHHTDDPDRGFESLTRHVKPGGALLIWTYSAEGNALVRFVIEPLRRAVLAHLPRSIVLVLSWIITAALYPIVHTVYRLRPLRFLPYYEYFRTFRRLSFDRNLLNVFDKLNAPQTRFITRATCERWMSPDRFEKISIRRNDGVGWSLLGVKRADVRATAPGRAG
jgi:2-polyprenyl-3-methyl-5-hydroxy-6-metoxy-1,4-benzoquinol methylase